MKFSSMVQFSVLFFVFIFKFLKFFLSSFQHVTTFFGCLFVGHFHIRMEVGTRKVDVEPPRHRTT